MMSVMVKRDDDAPPRERMVRAAQQLLGEHGLAAASFSAVIERSGAPRGSIYHHFPGGKDELAAAAVDRSRDLGLQAIASGPEGDAAGAARGLVNGFHLLLERSQGRGGCAIAHVTVEADDADLRANGTEAFTAWVEALTERFVAGGVPADRAPGLARTVVAGVEGGLVLARAEGSTAPLTAVGDELVALVTSAVTR